MSNAERKYWIQFDCAHFYNENTTSGKTISSQEATTFTKEEAEFIISELFDSSYANVVDVEYEE